MSEHSFEIEIKSLLGGLDAAEALKQKLVSLDPSCTLKSSYTQLNHYFEGGDPKKLPELFADILPKDVLGKMRTMAAGEKISVRTREMNSIAKIVMKASVGSDSSENGVARMEIEEPVIGKTLEDLDALVQSAGYSYQAKWSRTREEYEAKGVSVCFDKNAGYGYLAEFERVVDDAAKADATKEELLAFMRELGVEELPQDRLERMFAFYNAHWPEYYGTDKIFTID
jgi:adenylate cyclase class IV